MSRDFSVFSENDLLQQCSLGDSLAFTELFHRYKHKLYSFLLRITASETITEDIIQDIFLKLWQRNSMMAEIQHFDSYIFRMAKNSYISAFRKLSREVLGEAFLSKRESTGSGEMRECDIDRYISNKEIDKAMQQILSQLSPQQKQVYILSREYGLKYEDIALRLSISPATVRNHMIQALKKLRVYFRSYPDIAGCFFLLATLAVLLEK